MNTGFPHSSPNCSPILVTGAHRSGTTFVGRMLSIPREIGYIHEPFNKDHGLEAIDRWFLHLTEGCPNEPDYASSIMDLLHGRGRYKLSPRKESDPIRKILIPILRSKEHIQYLMSTRDPRVKRYLIKDPIACFSSEYLHRRFSMDVVIVVRHPAAFVSSLMRMNWRFDFADLLSQQNLMDAHIRSILERHNLEALSMVEEAALLWKCIYSTLITFCDRNPQMTTIRHEDVSYNPLAQFKHLYERCGIPYSPRCKKIIAAHTKATNPAAPVPGRLHTLKRDSRANIYRWKEFLTAEETDRIRSLTRDISDVFYCNEDW